MQARRHEYINKNKLVELQDLLAGKKIPTGCCFFTCVNMSSNVISGMSHFHPPYLPAKLAFLFGVTLSFLQQSGSLHSAQVPSAYWVSQCVSVIWRTFRGLPGFWKTNQLQSDFSIFQNSTQDTSSFTGFGVGVFRGGFGVAGKVTFHLTSSPRQSKLSRYVQISPAVLFSAWSMTSTRTCC